jgi:exonuclease SbcC
MKRLLFTELELRNLYGGAINRHLKDLDPGLNILLGPNASGKTTLARAAMRVLSPELAKGKDRVCAELVLDEDGDHTAYSADVDAKTKDAPWPQSLRPELSLLALDDLISGPGDDDTRVIREALAGGVDLRALFPYVNKRAPALTGVAKALQEREQTAARIAEEESRLEDLLQQRETLRARLQERDQLNALRDARDAALRTKHLADERDALRAEHPGIEHQPADAPDRAEQARERLRRLHDEHRNALRRLAPHGGRPATGPLPAADRTRLQTLRQDLDQLRKTRDRIETEHQTKLRNAEQRLEEARARLATWKLTLPDDYHPSDEAAALELLDAEQLPALQDTLREQLARKQALENEAALRESTSAQPARGLVLTAALATAALAAYTFYAYLQDQPDVPHFTVLSLGTFAVTLTLALSRRNALTALREDANRLRAQAEAIDTAAPEAELRQALDAFRNATGLTPGSGYSLDLATRRVRELCEARIALARAKEELERLQTHPPAESTAERDALEAEIANLYQKHQQDPLIPARGQPSDALDTFLAFFDLSEQAARAAERVRESEQELHTLLDRFGAPAHDEADARIDALRERVPAAQRCRALDQDLTRAQTQADTLSERVHLTPDQLRAHSLTPESDPAAIQAVLDPLRELEDDLKTLEAEIADIKTRVGVLEAGEPAEDLAAPITEADAFLRSFIERRAGFLVRETLEDAVRRENTPQVITGLETWLGRFTQNRYIQPEVRDGELHITDTQTGGAAYTPSQLSTGTRVHLALAVRLAVIETTETRGIRFPLFLDDILAVSDPEARRALREAIREIQSGRQLFLLTSRPEDIEGLDGKTIKF